MSRRVHMQASHWGSFAVTRDGGELLVRSHPADPAPSDLMANLSAALGSTRIDAPVIREGWLLHGPGRTGDRRGADNFVRVSWRKAITLVADELRRVYEGAGPNSIYGGSYGWASAGRFHHAQSQLHRFLNLCGGYVGARNTYSSGASSVILPHVLGKGRELWTEATSWQVILDHTRLILAFGGLPLKNSAVASSGVTRHEVSEVLKSAGDRGIEVALFSPTRNDMPDWFSAEWHAVRPGTDVAVMLGMAHTLVSENLHDSEFLRRCCVGVEQLRRYLLGEGDGVPKDPSWAEGISGVPSSVIASLARRAAANRTLVTCTFSLQRAKHGEQPVWMAVALAALLGQIGLPGGGFGHGYGCFANIGTGRLPIGPPTLPQGRNPVTTFIPVARVADMLLAPGAEYVYNGRSYAYPKVDCVYWSGGNPFHHHQDLGKLRRAFRQPDTIIVHEPFWTATAKHADIVLPSTTTLERNDMSASWTDPHIRAMHKVVDPRADARDDYDTLCDLSEALGLGDQFSEGRSERGWLEHLYDGVRGEWAALSHALPSFEEFWELGEVDLPAPRDDIAQFAEFRIDPDTNPLGTPSGKIELYSETVAGFGYEDCPGHPAWLDTEVSRGHSSGGRYRTVLIANNPASRLHGQLDSGARSQASKVAGREPVRLSVEDAMTRGISAGDVVRIYNDRGSCLAGAVLTSEIRPGVIQLSTGSWLDPVDRDVGELFCAHGNPNVLTADEGTSRLAQGCTGQLTLVEFERFTGALPPVRAFDPPPMREESAGEVGDAAPAQVVRLGANDSSSA